MSDQSWTLTQPGSQSTAQTGGGIQDTLPSSLHNIIPKITSINISIFSWTWLDWRWRTWLKSLISLFVAHLYFFFNIFKFLILRMQIYSLAAVWQLQMLADIFPVFSFSTAHTNTLISKWNSFLRPELEFILRNISLSSGPFGSCLFVKV